MVMNTTDSPARYGRDGHQPVVEGLLMALQLLRDDDDLRFVSVAVVAENYAASSCHWAAAGLASEAPRLALCR